MQELRKQLERKATFESAVRSLTSKLQQSGLPEPDLGEVIDCCNRVNTLLKARYSNIGFWKAGLELYRAAIAAASSVPALHSHIPKLTSYAAAASEYLAADTDAPTSTRQQTLGELLLGLPPPQETASHLSDAGLVLQQQAAPVQRSPVLVEQDTSSQPDINDLLQRLQTHRAESQQTQQQQDQQADTQQQQQAEAVLLETLAGQLPRAELEALLARLTEDAAVHQPPAKPPASKQAVARLAVITVDDAAVLSSLGGEGTACPVCTEELQLGDNVQQLPCKHVFHVPCLAPWLQQNNSCPVCRHELPTDDWKYEARKEKEAEEEEARRGAAAALSHNEFMYV